MAGAGYKLFNTGDVLTAAQVNTYLMQQTIMVFADSTARTTALSGVLAEGMTTYLQDTNSLEFWNGSAWVAAVGDITGVTAGTGLTGGGTSGTVTLTNDMAVTITAKGDLIAGTGNATYDNLAAGSDGDSLVADSAATTGLRWQAKPTVNKILNSDFSIWQRGTTFTTIATNGYSADRYIYTAAGVATNPDISRQSFSAGDIQTINYGDAQYFLRIALPASPSTTNNFAQRIEDVRTLANQTVTFSFWAKASANASITMRLAQSFGSGGSSDVNVDTSVSITATWARYTVTATLASIAGKTIGAGNFLLVQMRLPNTANLSVDTWGWQLEAGSVATAFQTATGTLQGELAACQRYAVLLGGSSVYTAFGIGQCTSTTGGGAVIHLPVQMRGNPGGTFSSTLSNYAVWNSSGTLTACTALTVNQANPNSVQLSFTVASGLTAGNATTLWSNNSTSGTILLSAEL